MANGYAEKTSFAKRETRETSRRDLKSRLHAGCELASRVGFRVRFLSAWIINRLVRVACQEYRENVEERRKEISDFAPRLPIAIVM